MKSTLDFDSIYYDMFLKIKNEGQWSSDKVRTKYIDGTPARRKQIFGYSFRFDNSTDVVPLITSRQIPVKSAIAEMYWIWMMQSNKVQDLRDLGCKFWNEWEKEDGTIGQAYGAVLAKPTFGHKSQLHYVIHELKNNPDSTRIITNLWDVSNLHNMALTPCVYETQWSVADGKVVLEVGVRSNDFALGLPNNVFQYSILHRLVAKEAGLPCGDMIYRIHNLHYYDRHEEELEKQFADFDMVKTNYPKIGKLNNESIFDFKPSESVNYRFSLNVLPKINYEIAI